MGAIPRSLLPDSATLDSSGRLAIAGCDVLELASTYGTPLFVYDEAHLRACCREAVGAFGDDVVYATKAFMCKAMASLAHEEGMQLDVATGGELFVAREAGVPPDRLVFHGSNKSTDELTQALEAGVGRVVVDSFDELDRLEWVHTETGQVAGCSSGSPRASRPTHTSTSGPATTTRSSGSRSASARRSRHSTGRSRRRPWTWWASTCTSAARSSRPTSSGSRSRRWHRW